MEAEQLARELSHIFEDKQYQWRVEGELITPDYDDLLLTIKSVEDRLKDEPDGTWLETGRLIFIKSDSLDVYVLQGTIESTKDR
jgi:hypothetical protein